MKTLIFLTLLMSCGAKLRGSESTKKPIRVVEEANSGKSKVEKDTLQEVFKSKEVDDYLTSLINDEFPELKFNFDLNEGPRGNFPCNDEFTCEAVIEFTDNHEDTRTVENNKNSLKALIESIEEIEKTEKFEKLKNNTYVKSIVKIKLIKSKAERLLEEIL